MSVFPFVVFLFFPFKLVSSGPTYYAELPSTITALSGSCMQIPCAFNAPNDTLNNAVSIFGFWKKGDPKRSTYVTVFDGSTNVTKGFSHIEIVGNLWQRECTTVFYDVTKNLSDNFYFRAEIDPGNWNYTYANPIHVSVSDVPASPVVDATDLKVMEGSAVTLSCSAEAPCPEQRPTISWSNISESANITTQIREKPDKTQSVFSLMSFKTSYRHHRKNISCTATYPRNTSKDSTVETTVTLRVLFPPRETYITINASDPVSTGTNVTLTCKSKANPSNNMSYTWYKQGQEKQLDFGDQLSFIVEKGSGGFYFCTAENELGSQTSQEIQLTVIDSEMHAARLNLIIVCVAGVAVFLFLFLMFTLFLRVHRVMALTIRETDVSDEVEEKHVQFGSVYTNSVSATDDESEEHKEDNSSIRDGEIDFSTPGSVITPTKSPGVETVYAEVVAEE